MQTEDIDMAIDTEVRDAIREIVADTVEVDVEEVGWNTHFWEELEADSLQGIEILAALERRFKITIDQSLLPEMLDVESTYGVVRAVQLGTRSDAG